MSNPIAGGHILLIIISEHTQVTPGLPMLQLGIG